MTCSLRWARRDEEGKRMEIHFKLVKETASWKVHRARFEQREPYEPDNEDWETLLEQMRRNLKRGKVYPEDIRIVERLRPGES
jgi:hypothetical protein